MKRTTPLVISMILVLMLAAMPAFAENTKAPLTETAAVPAPAISFDKAIALAMDAAPGYQMMSLSQEEESGKPVYQAELISQADGTMIEIIIDAASGLILSNKPSDEIAGENEQSGNENSDASIGKDDGQDQGENETADAQSNDDNQAVDTAVLAKAVVTFSQAEEIALTNNAGSILIGIQLEEENGTPVYSVMLVDASSQQFEYKIDAISGSFVPDDKQDSEN